MFYVHGEVVTVRIEWNLSLCSSRVSRIAVERNMAMAIVA